MQHLKPCAQHLNEPVPSGQQVPQPSQTAPVSLPPEHATGVLVEHWLCRFCSTSGGSRDLELLLLLVAWASGRRRAGVSTGGAWRDAYAST
jgi:hypothetical protein